MRGAFESVTRVAIEEIVRSHAQPSKFGFVLTAEGFEELTNDLYEFLQTSRALKAAGDRLIAGGPPTSSTSSGPRARSTIKPRP